MEHKECIREHMVKIKPAKFDAGQIIKLSTIVLLLFCFISTQGQELYVTEKKGSQDAYIIKNLEKLSFSPGNIHVRLTDNSTENYAFSDLRCLSFHDLGIRTNSINVPIQVNTTEIFPNPVSDILHINLNNSENKTTKLEIFSIHGKKIYSTVLSAHQKTHQISLPVFTKGVYICKIKNRTIKFIKY